MMNLHNPIFGGSIMFNAYGLLDREPNDIDVFTCSDAGIGQLSVENGWEELGSSGGSYSKDIFGNPLKRFNFRRRGVDVCVFVIPEEQHQYEYKYSSLLKLEIRCQLPIYGIEAKRQYFENYDIPKHGKDLVEIHHRLAGLTYPKLWKT